MPEHVEITRTLPADLATVLDRWSHPSTWSAESVAVTGTPGSAMTVEVQSPIDPESITESLRSYLPSGASARHVYTFTDAHHAALEATIKGAPLSVSASILLVESGTAQTVVTVAGTVSCSIPFLGTMVEKAALPVIERTIDQQIAKLS